MHISIRKGTPTDFKAINKLFVEFATFQKMPEKMTNTPELMLEEKDHFNCFVAIDHTGEIIGYASWFFAYYTWIGKSLYMDDLYVKEAFRKQGIGQKLIQSIIDFAKSENCKKVRWQVSNWNNNAIEFYKGLGARVDDMEYNCDLIL